MQSKQNLEVAVRQQHSIALATSSQLLWVASRTGAPGLQLPPWPVTGCTAVRGKHSRIRSRREGLQRRASHAPPQLFRTGRTSLWSQSWSPQLQTHSLFCCTLSSGREKVWACQADNTSHYPSITPDANSALEKVPSWQTWRPKHSFLGNSRASFPSFQLPHHPAI